MKKYTVTIIEDDLEFANLQKEIINEQKDFECIGIFCDVESYLSANKIEEDILLLDLILPGISGIDAIEPILQKKNDLSIVVNSSKDDVETILHAVHKGAIGYIDKQNFQNYIGLALESVIKEGGYMTPKIARRIVDYLQTKKKNEEQLTPKELLVANGIIDGLSYKLIADRMNISIETVRMYIRKIYKKYKIHSKSELINLLKKW